jgi:PPOX class probable F420-dependent enzyme
MGVKLDDDEVWAFLERGHTGILTTLRRDGWPVSLPVWYVVDDRRVYVGTPAKTKKVARVRHDARACFLVEAGTQWVELAAVELPVTAGLVEDEDEVARANKLFADKYGPHRPAGTQLPAATQQHYRGRATIRLDPAGKALSWDNARIRLRPAPPTSEEQHL